MEQNTGKNPERTCGGCTACCKTHEVAELKKPQSVWCRHCNQGVGCSVYQKRPSSCREFKCEWLKGLGEEADRPDLTNIVLDYVKTKGGHPYGVLQVLEVEEGALPQGQLSKLMLNALINDIFILQVYFSGRKILVVPSKYVTNQLYRAARKEGIEIKAFDRL